ncbi:MAG: rhodanese-like domain-containing protein, partial [Pseudomonadota bacterium]
MTGSENYLLGANSLAGRLNEDWLIIDTRFDLGAPEAGRNAYLEGHIPGAVYAHLDKDLSGNSQTDCGRHPMPAPEVIQTRFAALGVSDASRVVIYDDSGGMIAARAWWMLRYIGHKQVFLLDGGWAAWLAGGYKQASGEESQSAGSLGLTVNESRLVVHSALGSVDLLVDGREARRYRGEFEPIDPRAGHIPGAKNHFFGNNLNANKVLRSS